MRRFILGTDWWTDCDVPVAARVLARAHNAGRIRLCGFVLNACMPLSVPSVDPATGANRFRKDPAGPHSYVVFANPPEYYQQRINEMIRS